MSTLWRMGPALLLVLAVSLPAHAATRAWLDRDTVTLGETVTLNVESDDASAAPDFSVLAQDFELLGTSSGTQVRLDGMQRTVLALRAVALQPRRAGRITIPALAVGSETTQPLVLTVLEPAQAAAGASQDVFLEVEAEPLDPWVQQQVRYTLRLYYAVTLLEGQLDEPVVEGAEVRRLGQDASDQRTIDGRRYNVVERHYAVIPERSGALEIPAPMFRGRAILPGRRSSWVGGGAPVSAAGRALQLEVRPRPAQAATPWLPGAELTLEDASGALPAELRVGEPLTLTLRVRARGLGSAQLPELSLPPIAGADVYPDQAVARDGNDGPWLVGERERKFAIVPHVPGTLELPAVEVRWFDTDTREARVATLPARRLNVLPAAGRTQPAAPEPSPAVDAAATTDTAPAGIWPWLAAAFALLWLATLGWSLRRVRRVDAAPATGAHQDPRAREVRSTLRRALDAGMLPEVAQALLSLARAEGRPVRSLGELARALETPQREALRALDAARYGTQDEAAALSAARSAFPDARLCWARGAEGTPQAPPLPPLYPA